VISKSKYGWTRRGRLGGDSGGGVKLGPGLSFSWKCALGVTEAKRRVLKLKIGFVFEDLAWSLLISRDRNLLWVFQ
jgi:hypothetical protein